MRRCGGARRCPPAARWHPRSATTLQACLSAVWQPGLRCPHVEKLEYRLVHCRQGALSWRSSTPVWTLEMPSFGRGVMAGYGVSPVGARHCVICAVNPWRLLPSDESGRPALVLLEVAHQVYGRVVGYSVSRVGAQHRVICTVNPWHLLWREESRRPASALQEVV